MNRKILWAVALCLATTPAIAQRRPRGAQSSTGLTGEADERFRRGIELATENNYQAALVEFRRAYDVSRNALLLFNIAAMEVELNHFAEALDAVQEYERSAPPAAVEARRAQLAQIRERIQTRSGTITVAITADGLRVEVTAVGTSGVRVVREGAAASAPIRLPVGRYRVQTSAPGFRPREAELDVPGGADARIDRALEALVATVSIRSNVEGAQVTVDGRAVGVTPLLAQEMSEGPHRIEVTRPGYSSFAASITAQGTLGVVDANLNWAPSIPHDVAGRVALDLNYADVECHLDGQRVACDGSDFVPPGPHLLRVTGRDYLPNEQRVRLASGQLTRVELNLVARPEAIRESQERGNGQRRIGYIIGGVGLAVGIAGGVWLPLALSSHGATANQLDLLNDAVMECSRPGAIRLDECVNMRLGYAPMSDQAYRSPMEIDADRDALGAMASGQLLQAGIAGGLVGLGVIGITTGIIIVATAPGDRFATPPPRRAQLAPQFRPTLNGFSLRF